ncbi:MAG: nucleotidyltransferase family protein [Solirubrobacteraceae bacterium]
MTAPPLVPWGTEADRVDVWPTADQDQLLRAALLPDERAIAAWRDIRDRVDVASLDGATTALLPVLRRNLTGLGVQDELMELFKGVQRYHWARTQLLLEPLVPMVAALEDAGIATMLLKGGALTADGRLSAGLRPVNDLDVLVPTDRTADAVALLGAHGFVPVADADPRYVVDHAHRYTPSFGFRDGVDRQLDVHWHVLHDSCQPGADDDFWAAAGGIELKGVRTRSLCGTDELLLVVLHGLRWAPAPTYRWMVDAAMLVDGGSGPIDYDRLVDQARRRRLTAPLAAGLAHLRDVAGAAVPSEVLRGLGRGTRIERAELRARITDPRHRSPAARRLLVHEQHLRRTLPLGCRASTVRRVRAEAARLGITGPGALGSLVRGAPAPGPGRPQSLDSAAVGPAAARRPVTLGVPLDFRDWEVVAEHVEHGTWRNEPGGCWLAGRTARIVLPLPAAAPALLTLRLRALPLLGGATTSQRLRVSANGAELADVAADGPLDLGLVVAPEAVAGAQALELLLETPDAVSEAALGIGHGDRAMSFLLRDITVHAPAPTALGQRVSFVGGAADDGHLVGGWHEPEGAGRWTSGTRAVIALRLAGGPADADLVLEGLPFVGRPGRSLLVDVVAAGRRAGTLAYDDPLADNSRSVALRAADFGPGGEIVVELLVRDPRSPRGEGTGGDERLLGLCLAAVALHAPAG